MRTDASSRIFAKLSPPVRASSIPAQTGACRDSPLAKGQSTKSLHSSPLRGGKSREAGSRLLSFLTRIVLWIEVIDAPRTGAVELDDCLFVGEEIVLRTGGQRKEAARGKNLSLVVISRRSHPQARRPGEHGNNLRLGMGVRSYVVALRHFQTKSKQAFLARVAVK